MVSSSKAQDKFYTKPEIVKDLINSIDLKDYYTIEPSAGNGSFSKQIDCIAYDLYPEDNSIIKQDWLEFVKPKTDKPIAIIGNPPFGDRSKLAYLYEIGDTIKTYKDKLIINRKI